MVKQTEAGLDAVFAALADGTRRRILARLSRGEASVGELAAPQSVSWPAVTRHIAVLERAGLVSRRRDGRRQRMRFESRPLAEARAWIEKHRLLWEQTFDRLAKILEESAFPGEVKKQ